MALDINKIKQMAAEYSAAWSSGTPDAVASFYASDGQLSSIGVSQ